MSSERVFRMAFSKVYPLLVQKAERKGRTKEEVDEVIYWLTGYDQVGLQNQLDKNVDYETFFNDSADKPECSQDNRCGLWRSCGEHRRPTYAEDPLAGQACGRTGQGETHGEDSAGCVVRFWIGVGPCQVIVNCGKTDPSDEG